MGFKDLFKHGNEKDKGQASGQEDYKAPDGPPPSYAEKSSHQEKKADTSRLVHREQAGSSSSMQYTAPLGPPPNHSEYAPPPGPPPNRSEYAPPPGPPPNRAEYDPPPGPPPGRREGQTRPDEAPPSWKDIEDTSLLPPPPAFDRSSSSTTNAASHLADLAWSWTRNNPPFRPAEPHPDLLQSVSTGFITLRQPEHTARGESLTCNAGLSHIRTSIESEDHTYLSSLPLYFEHSDSPFRTERSKTIYYEIRINRLGLLKDGSDSSVAIGYCVAPYPTWRMPGWNRGSLAVHTDDGSRFMSHDGGGVPFLDGGVKAGETIGLGLRFSIPQWRPNQAQIGAAGQPLTAEIFFTRNGKYFGGWNIQEGLDAEDAWRADFLDGKWDLYAAIGTFGDVEVTANFGAQTWKYDPTTFTALQPQ